MPGFAPFAPSLGMDAYMCRNCGFWQRYFEPPPSCPLCLDSRHVVPSTEWAFYTLAEAQANFPVYWEELMPGLFRFWNDPVDGIGSHSYFLTSEHGNVVFEGLSVHSDEAIEFMKSKGGVDFLSASHPHTYGAIHQIQDAFEPELVLHPADLKWSSALRITYPFDTEVEIMPGVHILHTGVHFDGHSVLYDESRRLLLCGDALKFELNEHDHRKADAVSTHKAFVRGVPLTRQEAAQYLSVFQTLNFDQTFTPFEQVTNFGTEETIKLYNRMIGQRPIADPIDLANL